MGCGGATCTDPAVKERCALITALRTLRARVESSVERVFSASLSSFFFLARGVRALQQKRRLCLCLCVALSASRYQARSLNPSSGSRC